MSDANEAEEKVPSDTQPNYASAPHADRSLSSVIEAVLQDSDQLLVEVSRVRNNIAKSLSEQPEDVLEKIRRNALIDQYFLTDAPPDPHAADSHSTANPAAALSTQERIAADAQPATELSTFIFIDEDNIAEMEARVANRARFNAAMEAIDAGMAASNVHSDEKDSTVECDPADNETGTTENIGCVSAAASEMEGANQALSGRSVCPLDPLATDRTISSARGLPSDDATLASLLSEEEDKRIDRLMARESMPNEYKPHPKDLRRELEICSRLSGMVPLDRAGVIYPSCEYVQSPFITAIDEAATSLTPRDDTKPLSHRVSALSQRPPLPPFADRLQAGMLETSSVNDSSVSAQTARTTTTLTIGEPSHLSGLGAEIWHKHCKDQQGEIEIIIPKINGVADYLREQRRDREIDEYLSRIDCCLEDVRRNESIIHLDRENLKDLLMDFYMTPDNIDVITDFEAQKHEALQRFSDGVDASGNWPAAHIEMPTIRDALNGDDRAKLDALLGQTRLLAADLVEQDPYYSAENIDNAAKESVALDNIDPTLADAEEEVKKLQEIYPPEQQIAYSTEDVRAPIGLVDPVLRKVFENVHGHNTEDIGSSSSSYQETDYQLDDPPVCGMPDSNDDADVRSNEAEEKMHALPTDSHVLKKQEKMQKYLSRLEEINSTGSTSKIAPKHDSHAATSKNPIAKPRKASIYAAVSSKLKIKDEELDKQLKAAREKLSVHSLATKPTVPRAGALVNDAVNDIVERVTAKDPVLAARLLQDARIEIDNLSFLDEMPPEAVQRVLSSRPASAIHSNSSLSKRNTPAAAASRAPKASRVKSAMSLAVSSQTSLPTTGSTGSQPARTPTKLPQIHGLGPK